MLGLADSNELNAKGLFVVGCRHCAHWVQKSIKVRPC